MTADAGRARALFDRAMVHGRSQRWHEAGSAMAAAWLAAPDEPLYAQGLLESASCLADRPLPPADGPLATGPLSFVVCSISPSRLQRLRVELTRELAGEDWELVHIGDARSLAEAYNRGCARARGELLVFCHDDIGLLSDRLAARLRAHLACHDLIGVAGTNSLVGPTWFWAGPPHTASRVAEPQTGSHVKLTLLGTHAQALRGAQALDGVFLAGRRSVFEQVRFDDKTFDGFHLYDLDFSYRAHCAGFDCAVALDIVVWHASSGNFGAVWKGHADRFLRKHPALAPRAAARPYRPGAKIVQVPFAASTAYAWIDRWLAEARSETDQGYRSPTPARA